MKKEYDDEWISNDVFSEDATITIKNNRVSFNTQLVKDYNLVDSKYLFISAPKKLDSNRIRIKFILSKTRDAVPEAKPWTLSKHPKVDRFQATPVQWFQKTGIDSKRIEGQYVPVRVDDPKKGKIFTIDVELK